LIVDIKLHKCRCYKSEDLIEIKKMQNYLPIIIPVFISYTPYVCWGYTGIPLSKCLCNSS